MRTRKRSEAVADDQVPAAAVQDRRARVRQRLTQPAEPDQVPDHQVVTGPAGQRDADAEVAADEVVGPDPPHADLVGIGTAADEHAAARVADGSGPDDRGTDDRAEYPVAVRVTGDRDAVAAVA